jgi:hypothetical protein
MNKPGDQNEFFSISDMSHIRQSHEFNILEVDRIIAGDQAHPEIAKEKESFDNKLLEQRLRTIEEKLRETELRNETLAQERDRMRVDFEKIINELKQTKFEWALTEDQRDDPARNIKHDIKFLIGKLIKVRERLENPRENTISTTMSALSGSNKENTNTNLNASLLRNLLCELPLSTIPLAHHTGGNNCAQSRDATRNFSHVVHLGPKDKESTNTSSSSALPLKLVTNSHSLRCIPNAQTLSTLSRKNTGPLCVHTTLQHDLSKDVQIKTTVSSCTDLKLSNVQLVTKKTRVTGTVKKSQK